MEEDLVFVSQHLSIFNAKLESEECLSPGVSRTNNWQLYNLLGREGKWGVLLPVPTALILIAF